MFLSSCLDFMRIVLESIGQQMIYNVRDNNLMREKDHEINHVHNYATPESTCGVILKNTVLENVMKF